VRAQFYGRAYPVDLSIEQDLGIPGLAAFKQFLRPFHFLHKFVIADGARPEAVLSGKGVQ